MKRPIVVLCICFLGLGCSSKYIHYHSDASIPFLSSTIKSFITYIPGDEKFESGREYGIFSAIDSAKVYYILIAPQSPVKHKDKHRRFHLAHSVTIKPRHALEMINLLQSSIADWDNDYQSSDALFYNFIVAPEQKIKPVSANVVEWHPTFRYGFNNRKDGGVAVLIFGEGQLQYRVELKKRSELEDLRNLFEASLKDLESKGMR